MKRIAKQIAPVLLRFRLNMRTRLEFAQKCLRLWMRRAHRQEHGVMHVEYRHDGVFHVGASRESCVGDITSVSRVGPGFY